MELAIKLPQKIRFRLGIKGKKTDEAMLEELADLKLQLTAARSQFDILLDEDMIAACCFQMKSLSTRYNLLLREAKKHGLRCEPFSAEPSFQSFENGV